MPSSSRPPRTTSEPGGRASFRGQDLALDASAPRAEVLARRLEAMIRSGAIQPGSRLGTKDELRRQFGIAVGTLNEVLRVLDMRGVIESRPGPGGGVFVAIPSARVRLSHMILDFKGQGVNVKDCLVVRNSLELPVALEAGLYRTEHDLRELNQILDDMDQHLQDIREFLQLNWALHHRLAAICRNQLLRGLYSALLDLLEEELDAVSSDEAFDAHRNVRVHRQLVDAVASGSKEAIEKAVRRHTPKVRELPPPRT
jgi:DNA-binding FadR family transcriptional regulator